MMHPLHHFLLLLLATSLHLFTFATALGINYGTLGDNLPPPSQVANFIKTQTIFDSVKIFSTDPEIIRAFANTNISLTVTAGHGDIISLTNVRNSRRWVNEKIKPFYPKTKIKYICVGNEILVSNNADWINNVIPAMRSLNAALVKAGMLDIKVTTTHAQNIFQESVTSPSAARFRLDYAQSFFLPLLHYHRRTKSPFMINPYPFFMAAPETVDYAVFKQNKAVYDQNTDKLYTNMLDEVLDSTYSAMHALGYGDVDIVIGETGWPLQGESNTPGLLATMDNAISCNGNLIRELVAGKGTRLMPNRRIETYIFALFNENQKNGPEFEKHFGLFWPDFAPVYNSRVLRNGNKAEPTPAVPVPAVAGKQFCVPKLGVSDGLLQSNLDYACGFIGCSPILLGGPCFEPNNIWAHAMFAMNSYYRAEGETFGACNFAGTGQLTTVDPSYGGCQFL